MPWGAAIGAIGAIGASAISSSNGGNTTTTQSGPPAWVQQDYQKAAGIAQGLAGQPLNQYQGQVVAGFSPMQQQGMQGVESAQNIANPYINTASQYASSAGKPIGVPGQLSNGQLNGLYSQGLNYSNQAAGTNISGAGQPGIGQAYSGANYGQNAAGQGANSIGKAVGMGSAQNYGGNVQQYMSPYTQNVVNSTQAEFNNQNAQQQQGVIGNAVSSGAFGGDRASVAQGITAGQQALAQAPVIAGLENQGYTNAQNQLNTQQQLGIQGGQAAGQLGLSAGQLQSQTGLQAAGLGQSAAQQQAALQQQSAQAQMGLFSGQQQTGIGAQEASGWLGANAANIYGALGQQAQSSALTGASALYNMGSQQQNLEQEQLNVPYEQFAAQQAYPFQTGQYEINALEGLGSQSGGTSSTTAPGPSLISQGIGGAALGAGLYNSFGGGSISPYSIDGSVGGPALTSQSIDSFNPGGTSIPYTPQQTGGRIKRAAGGGMGMTNSPFGAFASPMASGMTFGQPPKAYASGGVAGLADNGIEDPSISVIPNMPDQTQRRNNIPPPPNPSPYSATGNSPNDMASLMQFSQMASSFNRGGTVPRGFASGGSQKTTNQFGQTGNMTNGFPTTGVVGSQMGSRGISHPMLAGPQNVAVPTDAAYGKNLDTNYSPPPVSSAPFTSTGFPVLNHGVGNPQTVTVTPVQRADGSWSAPLTQQYGEQHVGHPGYGTTQFTANAIKNGAGSNADAAMIPGQIDLSTLPLASGGPVGFASRSHYDDGGGIVSQTGAASAGLPVAGGNPIAQGMYSNIAHLPPEKLQELAVRLPPQSAQGQLVRRALQMSHVNPQASETQGQQQVAPQQAPQQSPLPQQQPTMARGGRLNYAPGGDIGLPPPDDSAFGGLDGLPDDLKPAGLSSNGRTIFDLSGGDQNLSAKGITTPVSGALASSSGPHGGSTGFTPRPAPTLTIPDAPSGVSAPPEDADLAGKAVNALSPTKGGQGEQSGTSNFMQSPWMALAATGAGMLASRDPHAGVAIGQGLETGLKFGEEQQKQQQENQWKNKDVDLRAQQLSQSLGEQKIRQDQFTAEQARLKQDHDDQVTYQNKDLAQRASDNAENRALRFSVANRPDVDYIGPSTDPANPGSVFLDKHTMKPVIVPMPIGSKTASAEGTSIPARDPSQSSEDYLKSLDPKVATGALDLYQGKVPWPTGMSARSPFALATVQAAEQAYPDIDATTYGSRQKAVNSFSPGSKNGDTVRSIGVAADHLDTLRAAIGALDNGDVATWNGLKNKFQTQFGVSDAPMTFDTVKQLVSDEVVKGVVGTAAGVTDRSGLQHDINSANAPQILNGVLDKGIVPLLHGQLVGLQHQYEVGTKRTDWNDRLSDAAKSIYNAPVPMSRDSSGVPLHAIGTLRGDPSTAAQFDAQFGKGASLRYLGSQ
jgi:hypothetical protein